MNECKQEYCDFVGSLAFEEDGAGATRFGRQPSSLRLND